MKYSDYLNSPHWIEFSAKMKDAALGMCEECGYEENLNVHHLHYETLGHESPEDVKVLCYRCHQEAHEAINQYLWGLQERKNQLLEKLRKLEKESGNLLVDQLNEEQRRFELNRYLPVKFKRDCERFSIYTCPVCNKSEQLFKIVNAADACPNCGVIMSFFGGDFSDFDTGEIFDPEIFKPEDGFYTDYVQIEFNKYFDDLELISIHDEIV